MLIKLFVTGMVDMIVFGKFSSINNPIKNIKPPTANVINGVLSILCSY